MGNFIGSRMVFECVVGEEGGYFDDEELIFNCGNFLFISVKMFCFNFFFISDLFLISNEFKEEADDKNGDDKEDKGMKTNFCEFDNVRN